jgi:serine/threonine protein kinase
LFFCLGGSFIIRGRTYRILNIVGQGGEATVYRCKDKKGTQHAVKVFYFSRYSPYQIPQRVDGFTREARILKYLSGRSPHFVHMVDYEYEPNENVGYMVMELGNGSLRQYLRGLPLDESTRQMFWQQIVGILGALEEAHIGNSTKKKYFILICISFYLKYMLISNLTISFW